jgi:glutaredoxin
MVWELFLTKDFLSLNKILLNFCTMKKSVAFLLFFLFLVTNGLSAQSQTTTKPEKVVMIVYGSDECHHCTDTKKYLKDNHIEFVFYDIDKNQEALKEMLFKLKQANISTNNLSIPVIDKQGVIFTNNIPFEEFLKKLN